MESRVNNPIRKFIECVVATNKEIEKSFREMEQAFRRHGDKDVDLQLLLGLKGAVADWEKLTQKIKEEIEKHNDLHAHSTHDEQIRPNRGRSKKDVNKDSGINSAGSCIIAQPDDAFDAEDEQQTDDSKTFVSSTS